MSEPDRAPAQLAQWIEQYIKELVETSPDNSLQNQANERAWDEPLVGFSRGDDPLYRRARTTSASSSGCPRRYST